MITIFLLHGKKNVGPIFINDQSCTGGPLLTRFFETLEKQPCKRRSDLVLNGQMRVPK